MPTESTFETFYIC